VWKRPALDRRARFLISLAGAACEGGRPDVMDGYVRGALKLGELALGELREAALHLSVYAGWSRGIALDAAISRVAAELGLPPAAVAPIRGAPWDPEVRLRDGAANFQAVMTTPGPRPSTPYFEAGILNFVFGEMWMRPGLDQRSRRWITLVGVADSSASTPIRTHTYAAMASGNATLVEMQEFVLQYAIHGSWPKASVLQGAVIEMADRITKGLPYQ
jgi:4-carboxymuconolactone decarboxylase